MAAGTRVRVQKDANSSASSYTVDFMEFEQVAAPLSQPSGSVSVTSHGADPTGAANATAAFNAAIAAAGPGGTVWIPAGRFLVTGHLVLNNINIRGAGIWHSIVGGEGIGFYGRWANEGGSSNVNLSHFQIRGEVIERCDACQVNGIGGAISNSNINNIWIEHTKVGMWMDGPFTNLTFDRMRVRDQTADGVNFHKGVTNSVVSNSHFRNTGDDAMAMWSEQVENANNIVPPQHGRADPVGQRHRDLRRPRQQHERQRGDRLRASRRAAACTWPTGSRRRRSPARPTCCATRSSGPAASTRTGSSGSARCGSTPGTGR